MHGADGTPCSRFSTPTNKGAVGRTEEVPATPFAEERAEPPLPKSCSPILMSAPRRDARLSGWLLTRRRLNAVPPVGPGQPRSFRLRGSARTGKAKIVHVV